MSDTENKCGDITQSVLDFLKRSNRPYLATELVNSGNNWDRAAVNRALEKLLNREKIGIKINGPQRVYFYKHDGKMENLIEDLNLCKSHLAKAQLAGRQKQLQLTEKRVEIRKIQLKPNKQTLKEERDKLIKQIKDLQAKLELRQSIKEEAKLSAHEAERIERHYNEAVRTYQSRKRICVDIMRAMLEDFPDTKAKLDTEVDVVTDEDVGFKLNIE